MRSLFKQNFWIFLSIIILIYLITEGIFFANYENQQYINQNLKYGSLFALIFTLFQMIFWLRNGNKKLITLNIPFFITLFFCLVLSLLPSGDQTFRLGVFISISIPVLFFIQLVMWLMFCIVRIYKSKRD